MNSLRCILRLALLLLSAACCAANHPGVSALVETVLSDPIFWKTEYQEWSDTDPRICIFDPAGLDGRGLCKTNIGYYIKSSGLDKAKVQGMAMNFYLRFQMKDACHNAVVSDSLRGTYCGTWGEDWSRVPLSPNPSKFNISTLCRTVYTNGDATKPAIGCANNYAPWSLETDAQWAAWKACQNPLDQAASEKCVQTQFMWQTGWNFTVLRDMVDIVIQNGNDCQKWYQGSQDSYPVAQWQTFCEGGAVPAPAVHPVLTTLALPKPVGKDFRGSFNKPLDAYANFNPPPPSPPSPPPSPPSPPSPPPSPSPPVLLISIGPAGATGASPDLKSSASGLRSMLPLSALAALVLTALLA